MFDEDISVVRLAQQKVELLKQYLNLSYAIGNAALEDLFVELEALLAQKDQIIKEVDQVDAQLRKLFNKIEVRIDDTAAAEYQQQWLPLKKEIESLLSKVNDADYMNRARLYERKEQLANMLKTIQEEKKGLAIYEGKHVHIEGLFLDKKR